MIAVKWYFNSFKALGNVGTIDAITMKKRCPFSSKRLSIDSLDLVYRGKWAGDICRADVKRQTCRISIDYKILIRREYYLAVL